MRRSRAAAPIREPRVVRLEPGNVVAALAALAARLESLRGGAVTLDLRDVPRVGVEDLRALEGVLRAAHDAGLEIRCTAVTPVVYKALHLAKLATLVTRVPNVRSDEEGSR